MSSGLPQEIALGRRIRITQEIAARHYTMVTPIEGIVVCIERRPTGSWFAHGESDKLWLDRIVLKKSDGELSTISVDEHTSIQWLD